MYEPKFSILSYQNYRSNIFDQNDKVKDGKKTLSEVILRLHIILIIA